MMMPVCYLLLNFIQLEPLIPPPGPDQVVFERISLEQGLAQSTVTCMLQDKRGFIWIGTGNGLNKYDGYTFAVFRHNPDDPETIANDWIRCLYEDRSGSIWVGTLDGLCRLSHDQKGLPRFSVFKNNPKDDRSLSYNIINAVSEDHAGFIWVACPNGLNRLDTTTGAFTRFEYAPNGRISLTSSYITTLMEDSSNNLWVGTNGGGLNQFSPDRQTLTAYVSDPQGVGTAYLPEVEGMVENLAADHRQIAALLKVTDGKVLEKSFEIKEPMEILVAALGEGGGPNLSDFGGVREGDQTVWSMEARRTRHAGGAWKNRIQLDVIKLHPGRYTLWYQSDHSHAFGRWNRLPPRREDLWGIQLLRLTPDEANAAKRALPNIDQISPMMPGNHISALFEDSRGRFWVGTSGAGVSIMEGRPESQPTFRNHRLRSRPANPNYQPLAGDYITSITEDLEGRIWIGSSEGLSRYIDEEYGFETYRNDPHIPTTLSINQTSQLMVDRSGTLWVGTVLGGVNKLSPRGNRFSKFTYNPFADNTMKSRLVYSFYVDENNLIWVGGNRGVSIYDPQKSRYVFTDPNLPINTIGGRVMAIIKDSRGHIWIASDGFGLTEATYHDLITPANENNAAVIYHHTTGKGPRGLSSKNVFHMMEDSRGIIWIATFNGGVNLFDPTTRTFRYLLSDPNNPGSLAGNIIRTFFEDSRDSVWVGTDGAGLCRFNREGGTFETFQHIPGDPTSLSHNRINAIYEDDHGHLWVATYGGGLNKMDRDTQTFKRYTEKDGLPNNVIYSILPDEDGNLWLSSNKGLTRFTPDTGRMRNYDVQEGLQSNEFNTGAYLRHKDGTLLFGGVAGFNVFRPETIRDNPHQPPIVINEVRKHNQIILTGGVPAPQAPTILSHEENFISFDFAALDYTNPATNRYAYMLEGVERDWVQSGTRRFAGYANLAPGDYVFRVKGANSDGVWNETGAHFAFRITPPFWRTGWFLSLAVITFLFLVFGLYRVRVKVLRREKELQEVFSKQLIQSQEQERRRIAGELHDSLGQNLLVIHNEIHQTKPETSTGERDRLAGLVLEALNEVREISYNLHPHQLDRLGLKKALESVVNKVAHATDIAFDVNIDDLNRVFDKQGEIHFFRIIQEAVNNIVKHSNASRAVVDIVREAHAIHVTIRDNGRGFSLKDGNIGAQGFGLSGIAERIKLLGGTLKYKTAPGQGVSAFFHIPIPTSRSRV